MDENNVRYTESQYESMTDDELIRLIRSDDPFASEYVV